MAEIMFGCYKDKIFRHIWTSFIFALKNKTLKMINTYVFRALISVTKLLQVEN